MGAREVGFTVLSMSLSLIAVFVPILLMGGIVGRLFREFAMTLSIAILISLVVSLTTTPMMCAYLAGPAGSEGGTARCTAPASGSSTRCSASTTARWRRALRWPALVMLSLLATIGLNVYLFIIVPKGFFPQQDTGRMIGGIQADQSISFQLMQQKLTQFVDIIRRGPGGRRASSASPAAARPIPALSSSSLKPLAERELSADQVIGRLRGQARRRSPARGCSCRRCRTSGSAGGRATRNTSTRCRATTWPSSTSGRRRSPRRCRSCRS